MVLVGLLLIAVAAGFTIDVFAQNTADIDVDVLGRTFSVSPGWLVVAGAVALAALLVGVRLVGFGIRRVRARRSALRSAQLAAQERDQLARQLVVERAEHGRDTTTGEVDPNAPETTPEQTPPDAGSGAHFSDPANAE
jgi:hypothetical protein